MRLICTLFLSLVAFGLTAQNATIQGQLQDADKAAVSFANVALFNTNDSTMVKVETTDDSGVFRLRGLNAGNYYLEATFVGQPNLTKNNLQVSDNQQLDLGVLSFAPAAVELESATVTAQRAMVEIKPDRTVFNVQGTINSTGANAIELLRKAPSVLIDNNDNINVLGRSGVLVYVDGKRLPLGGDDLTNYLQNLPAEQIDRIDIITSPGAKYEAQGNAGIIDIRLKKDKNLGGNGSLSGTISKGRFATGNVSASGNYRTKKVNIFAQAGYNDGRRFNDMDFNSTQNNVALNETNRMQHGGNGYNVRLGTDFFINDKNTIGFLVGHRDHSGFREMVNRIEIAPKANPNAIDSILVADGTATGDRLQNTFNINYAFNPKKGRSLNIDADYGQYRNTSFRRQPNVYYAPDETTVLTSLVNAFETPTDIDIYTFKADFEEELLGGKLGLGTKFSKVVSDNTFLFFDEIGGENIRNDRNSNSFKYDEMVSAGYINFQRSINQKVNVSAGLRAEHTDAVGDLTAFLPELQEDPVVLNYWRYFPSAGITWQVARMHALSANYGRRINRPDYNVLNPFNNQLSQISYEKGNPFLRPEIVSNYEIGYTYAYRFNFKLAYSRTLDQITRLIGPDENDPRANFITWDNLATQDIYSFNASLPFQFNDWWSAFFNASASHINNQADYGDGAVVDVQAFSYNFYTQQSFTLPKGFKGEVSGWYSGPGIWGGVFEYGPSWSLNLGLQRKFLQDKMNVRLAANDLFYKSGWNGVSEFNGLVSEGQGRWDSRRLSLSVSYNFGNQNVKSRKRKTGIEDEAKRVGE